MKSLRDLTKELDSDASRERMESTGAINRRYNEEKTTLKEAHYKKYKNENTARMWCEQNDNKFHWCDETRVVFDAGGGQVWVSWDRVLDDLPVYD